MRETYGLSKTSQILNKIDERGLGILHYFLALDYFEIIGVFSRCGGDLELKTGKSYITPSMICTMLDCRKSLNQLLLNGVSLLDDEEEKHLS